MGAINGILMGVYAVVLVETIFGLILKTIKLNVSKFVKINKYGSLISEYM